MPGIFISYRRSDSPDAVGRLYDRLVSEFGKSQVFKDVDSIPLGQDFRGHLNDIVGGCAAMLAIIGPKWIDARNETGQRRLDDPGDFVRIELEAALARGVPVVPVLVGHVPIPVTSQLPESLASLAFRQSIEVRPDPDFHNDATRLVVALRQIIDPDAPQEVAASASGAATQGAQPKRSAVPWLIGLAAAATLAAIALAMPALKHLREAPPPETRTEISAPTDAGNDGQIALSPDGRQIVFVATNNGVQSLWLRALGATTAQLLPGTEGGGRPFWSPDSRSIGFFTEKALKVLKLGSGAPLTLAPVNIGAGGGWNADDMILFAELGKGLAMLAATGGPRTEIKSQEEGTVTYLRPVFLPDGRFIYGAYGDKKSGIYLGALDGSASRLTTAIGNFAYLPSGWLLVWDQLQQVLVAQRLDLGKGVLVGAPLIVAEGSGVVSTSATGLVAYWKDGVAGGNRQLQWHSRAGTVLGTIGEPDGTTLGPRVAPDGRRVVVSRGGNAKQDIWVLDGERSSRLTFDAAGNIHPLFSIDGLQIAYGVQRSGTAGIYQRPADGTGTEQLLVPADLYASPTSFSSDGRYLLYDKLGSGILDIGVLPMMGERKPRDFLASPHVEGLGDISPDGKWVAYASNESGRNEVYIRPFVADAPAGTNAAPTGKWQVSTAGGIQPKWNPNGKELFFLNPAGDMMAAPIPVAGSALTPGTPVKLFATGIFGGGGYVQSRQYDVARDGRFLINTQLDAATAVSEPIILIQNWNPESKQ